MAKRLTAKQIVDDINAGFTDEELIAKYNLSDQLLVRLFDKLVSIRAITREDLDARKGRVQSVVVPVDEGGQEQYPPTQLLDTVATASARPEPGPEPPSPVPRSPRPPRPTEESVGPRQESGSPFAAIRHDFTVLARKYRFSREDVLRLGARYGLDSEVVDELLRPREEEVTRGPAAKEKHSGSLAAPAREMTTPAERPVPDDREEPDEGSDDVDVESVAPDEEKGSRAEDASGPDPKPDESPMRKPKTVSPASSEAANTPRKRTGGRLLSGIWFLLKFAFLILTAGILVASALGIRSGVQLGLIPEFQKLKPIDPVPEARKLVKEGRYCDAMEYLRYCRQYPEIRSKREVDSYFEKTRRITKEWWDKERESVDPFLRDRGPCLAAIVDLPASTFYTSEELSDLAWKRNAAHAPEKPDEFSAALGGLRKLLSGPDRISSVQEGRLKGTVSLLTAAKWLHKITPAFEEDMVKAFGLASTDKSIKPVVPLVRPIWRMSKKYGLRTLDVFDAVARCDGIPDLGAIEKIAAVYRARTSKFLTLGGDAARTAVNIYSRDARLPEAMDAAILFGSEGAALLERVGPKSFMTQAALATRLDRASRVTGMEQALETALPYLKPLPRWSLLALGCLTGAVVLVGLLRPLFRLLGRMQTRRLEASTTA
jgi:hypothetical protein